MACTIWKTKDGNFYHFGEVATEASMASRVLHSFSGEKYVSKPGSSARCHSERVMRNVRKNYTNGKKRGRKGSRRVRKAH